MQHSIQCQAWSRVASQNNDCSLTNSVQNPAQERFYALSWQYLTQESYRNTIKSLSIPRLHWFTYHSEFFCKSAGILSDLGNDHV